MVPVQHNQVLSRITGHWCPITLLCCICRTPSSGRLARSVGVLRKRSLSDGESSTAQVCLSSLEHPSTSRYLPGPATKGLHAVSVCVCGMLGRRRKKTKEKTTSFGVNLMRSQVLSRAAQSLGAICVSAALTCSLCKSACACCWCVVCSMGWISGHHACLDMTPGLWLQHFNLADPFMFAAEQH